MDSIYSIDLRFLYRFSSEKRIYQTVSRIRRKFPKIHQKFLFSFLLINHLIKIFQTNVKCFQLSLNKYWSYFEHERSYKNLTPTDTLFEQSCHHKFWLIKAEAQVSYGYFIYNFFRVGDYLVSTFLIKMCFIQTTFFWWRQIGALNHGRPRQDIHPNVFSGHRQRLKLWLGRGFDHYR